MDFTVILSTCKFGDTSIKDADKYINEKLKDWLDKELKEIPKLLDHASGHGDSEGYARVMGQDVLLQRLIKKFEA